MNIIIRPESLPGRGGRRSEGGRLGNKTPRRSWPSSCKGAGCQPLWVWNMPRRKGRSPRDRCHASTEGLSLCHLSKYSRSSNATEPSAGFHEAGSRTRLRVPGTPSCRRKKAAPEQSRHRGRSFSCLKYKNSSLPLSLLLVWLKNEFFFYLTDLIFNDSLNDDYFS